MNKNKLISASMIALLSASTVAAGATAFAAGESSTASSSASISFINETDKPTGPVDPGTVDPTNPDNPDKNVETGNKGPLSLDVVPNLGFGEHDPATTTREFVTTNAKPQIQITDSRALANRENGWILNVSLAEIKNGSDSLSNAKIALPTPTMEKYTEYTEGQNWKGDTIQKPVPGSKVDLTDGSIIVPTGLVLTANGTETEVARAKDKNSGRLTSLLNYAQGDVKLTFDNASVVNGQYKGVMDWKLASVPTI